MSRWRPTEPTNVYALPVEGDARTSRRDHRWSPAALAEHVRLMPYAEQVRQARTIRAAGATWLYPLAEACEAEAARTDLRMARFHEVLAEIKAKTAANDEP